jgi:1,4-alpha-glucan branching enzyme
MPSPPDRPSGERLRTTRFTDLDIHLFSEGTHTRLYEKLGAHRMTVDGVEGVYFAVWAPNAGSVSVIGDWNFWDGGADPMDVRWDQSGIWECFVPQARVGQTYKYRITNRDSGEVLEKGDPFAFAWEVPPKTASVIWELDYAWKDHGWMDARAGQGLDRPVSVYEVHAGSWRRVAGEGWRSLSYRELGEQLGDYLVELGFTHVEFLPLMEHPFYGSWGYQTTGYFAPTSRFGTPQDCMAMVDALHERGIGVILDWVPSHFPEDAFALARFDGTHLYEHADPRKGFHPDWKSLIFNYGRHEVRSFLLSSAAFWCDRYHADGLRVDAVASMLYLDYSRKEGEWEPNAFGGRENLEAIGFLRALNEAVYREFPGVQTIAEESTSWPMVSRPTYMGGLGFGMKWMMGWMHDTLEYFQRDPIYRRYHQGEITFSLLYAFTENFMLPLSHDEVVHGKGSLMDRMPGDDWQQFANLRLLYAYMWTHPGAKLLFMGSELGQRRDWQHDGQLPWELAEAEAHAGVRALVRDLNALYRGEPALYERQFSEDGFRWIDAQDYHNCVLSWLRLDAEGRPLLVVANFTPQTLPDYAVGVPLPGAWTVRLNSDAEAYWGSGVEAAEAGTAVAADERHHGQPATLRLTLPPLGLVVLAPAGADA